MMLELDNLDLDLDEDFPTGPLNKIISLDNSFCEAFPWSQNKIEEKTNSKNDELIRDKNTSNLLKVNKENEFIPKVGDLFKKSEFSERIVENDLLKDYSKSTNVLNNSFNLNNFSGIDKSELNDSKDANSAKRILTQRKFPGPAGLLPDKPLKDLSDLNLIVDNSYENVTTERQKESVILCSQSSSVFSEASFKKLTSDFDMNEPNCPLNKYTVDWVKKRALKKTLFGKKIPFLALVLHHLDHSTPDPVLTLRDQTGEIYGTLHREVWSELGEKLHPGAALALRQVGVLITGITRRQVYLNITINNIVNVYSYSDDENIEVKVINEVKKIELMKNVCDWECTVASVDQTPPSPQPFSTIVGRKSNFQRSYFGKSHNSSNTSVPVTVKNHPKDVQQLNTVKSTSANQSCVNKTNAFMSMDDDFADFFVSFDEDSMIGKSASSETGHNGSRVSVTGKECDGNVRKRKMDADGASSSSSKTLCKHWEDGFVAKGPSPPSHNGRRENLAPSSQALSQAESQIVEEVLDGINFDDFDM